MEDVPVKLYPGFPWQREAFNNKEKKKLFASKLDSHLRKKLVKWYIWSIAF
jgi:hypothetical protein